jgi:hypothetical protein
MGVAHYKKDAKIEPERVTVTFERGVPAALNGRRFESMIEAVLEANRIGGRHGLGMSDQIENRVIDAKSRGIYEAPGMALFHIAYERLLSAIHNENTIDLYATLGRRLGRLLYEGKWFDPEAMLVKDALTRWIAPSVSGVVELELRRGDDYSIQSTQAEYMAYAPEKLSMEKVAGSAFAPSDRIGALEMQTLPVTDNRSFLEHHLEAVARLGAGENPRPELLGKKDGDAWTPFRYSRRAFEMPSSRLSEPSTRTPTPRFTARTSPTTRRTPRSASRNHSNRSHSTSLTRFMKSSTSAVSSMTRRASQSRPRAS